MGKRKLTYNHFKKYFGNRQKSEERHAFERDMMQDAFDEEAFDGLSKLSPEEMEEDIEEIKSRIDRRAQKKSRTFQLWLRYAAGVALLAGIGAATFYILNNQLKHDIVFEEPLRENIAMSDTAPEEEPKKIMDETVQAEKSIEQPQQEPIEKAAGQSIEATPVPEKEEKEQMLEMTDVGTDDELLSDEFVIAKKEEIKKEKQEEKTTETLSEMAIAEDQSKVKAETTSTEQAKSSEKNLAPTSSSMDALAGVASEEENESRANRKRSFIPYENAIPPGTMTLHEFKKELAKRIQEQSITNKNLTLTLFIDSTGKVQQIEIKENLNREQKSTIRDLIIGLGLWKPAIKKGDNVPSKVHIEIMFDIE